MSKKEFNISNILTVSRLLLGPIIFILILYSENYTAFSLALFAFFTDFLDGKIARKFNLSTRIGQILDPLADKLLFGWILFGILIVNKLYLWIWIFSIIGIILFIGYYFFVKKKLKVSMITKTMTFFEFVIVMIFLLGYVYEWLLIIMALSFIVTIIYHILNGVKNK